MVWGSRRLPQFGTHLSRKRKGKTSPRGILVKFPVTPQVLKSVVILLLLLLEMLIQWQFVSSDTGTDTSGNAAWPKSTPTWKYPSKDSSDRDVWPKYHCREARRKYLQQSFGSTVSQERLTNVYQQFSACQ